jgi:uncharacterized protein (TIGR04255 family)
MAYFKKINFYYLSVAEIRFTTEVDLAGIIPKGCEFFSKANYGNFSVLQNQSVKLEEFGEQRMLIPTIHKTYAFANADVTRQFSLNEHCLALKVTDFHDFESFMALFQEGVYIANRLLNIVATQRVGCRLLKRIIPRSDLGLKDYLQPSEAKLLGRFGGLSEYSHTEVAHQFNDIRLLHRVKTCPQSGLELPKDIQANDMTFRPEVSSHHGPSIFMDSDGYTENSQDLSFIKVKDSMKKIHEILGLAFKSSVSDLAVSEIAFR